MTKKRNTKQSFFGAIKTASNRVKKHSFDFLVLSKLYQTALSPTVRSHWTPGYLQNILRWKHVCFFIFLFFYYF